MSLFLRLLIAAACVVSFPLLAHAQTQLEMNEQACQSYKTADAEMNRTYQGILREYRKDRRFILKLKAAQRAWLVFRDAHLESVYPAPNKRAEYGSVNPLCQCQLLQELTEERLKALRKWLDGQEEGDVCTGSVKIKE